MERTKSFNVIAFWNNISVMRNKKCLEGALENLIKVMKKIPEEEKKGVLWEKMITCKTWLEGKVKK